MIFIVAVLACVLALSHAAAVPPLSEFSLVLIIVLYPQAYPNDLNPNGCWDWYGICFYVLSM